MDIKYINVLAEAEEDLESGRSFYEGLNSLSNSNSRKNKEVFSYQVIEANG